MLGKSQKKNPEWQRKTYPLKLKLDENQKQRLDAFLEEYAKATNFVISKCTNELFPFFKRISQKDQCKKETKPFTIGKCFLCGKQKDLKYEMRCPNGKKKLNCGCLNGHYSLRKIFLPSKNYSLNENNSTPEWDMRFAGKLYDGFPKILQGGDKLPGEKEYNRGVYDSCLQKVVETIKSQNALNAKIDWQTNNRFQKNVAIKRLLAGEKPEERHKKDFEFYSQFQPRKLKKFLNRNNEKLRRLKNKRAEKVFFKGNMARIYDKYYAWVERKKGDWILSLNLFEKPMLLDFFGNEYQKKKAELFVKQERQPEIELVKRGGNYFVQYIFRQAQKTPVPDETFTAVGIDLGILNHACIACLKKDSKKPFGIKFYNGRPTRRKRRQYYKIRRIWQKKTKQQEKNGKGRSMNWYRKKCKSQNEERFVKTELHKVSTNIIQHIYNTVDKPVLILENLKHIREETKKMKRSHLLTLKRKLKGKARKWYLKERYLNKELNNWNFAMLHSFLKYKAEWFGIPVVVLPAKNTSIECNKCGHIDEKNYADLHQLKFKCLNCGYQCNADYNAACNLAKNYFAGLPSSAPCAPGFG